MSGYGLGTISKGPNSSGLYQGRIWIDGKRISVYGHSREETASKMAARRSGIQPPARDISLGTWIDRWLEDRAIELRPRTLKGYRQKLGYFGPLRSTRLRDLRAPDISRIIHGLDTGPQTKAHAITVLRNCLGAAFREDLISRNPALSVRPPAIPDPPKPILEPQQLRTFLESIRDHRLYPLFALAIYAGLRRSELLGASREDLTDSGIRIRRGAQDGKLYPGKSPRAYRVIPLPPDLLALLRAQPAGLLFPGKGGPLHGSKLGRYLGDALAAAGLPRIGLQGLRRSFISALAAEGIDARTIMELAGHASITTTLGIYARSRESSKLQAARVLTSLIGPTDRPTAANPDPPAIAGKMVPELEKLPASRRETGAPGPIRTAGLRFRKPLFAPR